MNNRLTTSCTRLRWAGRESLAFVNLILIKWEKLLFLFNIAISKYFNCVEISRHLILKLESIHISRKFTVVLETN
jgi:hypothetical protein